MKELKSGRIPKGTHIGIVHPCPDLLKLATVWDKRLILVLKRKMKEFRSSPDISHHYTQVGSRLGRALLQATAILSVVLMFSPLLSSLLPLIPPLLLLGL